MATRPSLEVFQALGLQPSPPPRAGNDATPALRTAVRGGLASPGSEVGPAPAPNLGASLDTARREPDVPRRVGP